MSDVKAAKASFAATRSTDGNYKEALKPIIQARKEAQREALKTFKDTVHAAAQTLKAALNQN
jgi:hypothetical protein